MKKNTIAYIGTLLIVAGMGILMHSCQKEKLITPANPKATTQAQISSLVESTPFVLATHYDNLPSGVKSVQVISKYHPLFLKALSILTANKTSVQNIGDEIVLYWYSNETVAVLFYNSKSLDNYAYISNSVTGETLDFLRVDIEKIAGSSSNIDIVSMLSNEPIPSKRPTWGGCMKKAISKLYDDWDNDPVGTFSCWATGGLCAIGGGIACAIS